MEEPWPAQLEVKTKSSIVIEGACFLISLYLRVQHISSWCWWWRQPSQWIERRLSMCENVKLQIKNFLRHRRWKILSYHILFFNVLRFKGREYSPSDKAGYRVRGKQVICIQAAVPPWLTFSRKTWQRNGFPSCLGVVRWHRLRAGTRQISTIECYSFAYDRFRRKTDNYLP